MKNSIIGFQFLLISILLFLLLRPNEAPLNVIRDIEVGNVTAKRVRVELDDSNDNLRRSEARTRIKATIEARRDAEKNRLQAFMTQIYEAGGTDLGVDALRQLSKTQVELKYLPFIEMSNLPEEQKHLILAKLSEGFNTIFDSLNGASASGSGIGSTVDMLQKSTQSIKDEIEKVLADFGESDEFYRYQEELPIREMIERFAGQAATLDYPVSGITIDTMIALLGEGERIDRTSSGIGEGSEARFGAQAATDEIQKLLNDAQITLFKKFMLSRIAQQDMYRLIKKPGSGG